MKDRELSAMKAETAGASDGSRAAVDGMARAMIEQMQDACTELQRVDELLGDAIGQLMVAFNRVSEPARMHQRELSQAAAAAGGLPAAAGLQAAAARVAREIDTVVTALQFRDVVGQKLGHVRSELEALERTMHGIREICVQSAQVDLAPKVCGLLMQLQQGRATSPVRQELMQAGEIELF